MPKYVLYFRTKHGEDPSPFRKLPIPKYDTPLGNAFAAILDEPSSARAWNKVLACYPDYSDAGAHLLADVEKMPSREKPDTLVEPDLEWVVKKHT